MKSNEPRRLIKFGNSSYVVSLPKEWIEKNNLKKGELIYMDYSKNKLVLSPMAQNYVEEERKMIIEAKEMDRIGIKREILSSYSKA
jgi:phosphate uptake regulator